MPSNPSVPQPTPNTGPWWKHPIMWLVVGGPTVVVVASFITLYLAVSRPDPVYSDAQRPYAPIAQPAEDVGKAELAPALQARNHAATGGLATGAEPAASAAAAAQR